MEVLRTLAELDNWRLRHSIANPYSLGFVPTMGALHEGHLSLIKTSQAICSHTLASIFVNPTQFNDPKDFEKYPRTTESDIAALQSIQCDALFLPSVEEMYQNPLLSVEPFDIGYLDTILEGAKRPGHYQGVATIVEKLFKAVQPHKVFMGLKDFQQVKVVEKLVMARKFPLEIIGCPTLREANGLAMSSRNMRLPETAKEKASCIYRCLSYTIENKGQKTPLEILEKAKTLHLNLPELTLEYLELRNAQDLSEISMDKWGDHISYVALFAGWLEGVRLIDNMVG